MTIDKDDLLNSILSNIAKMDLVKSSDIPNIDLYMDQVTTFMENALDSSKRYPEDKILTKTMINNYAKNDLLPPPTKKKYSKEHLMVLTFIYYFKNILSIKDIETVLKPISEKYFHSEGELNVSHIYDEVCTFEKERASILQEDIKLAYEASQKTFSATNEEDREFLQFFSFICLLGLDVYVKKQIIEKLVDIMAEAQTAGQEDLKKEQKKESKKENKK